MNILEKQIIKTKKQIEENQRLLDAGWEEAEEYLNSSKESLAYWEKELTQYKLKTF